LLFGLALVLIIALVATWFAIRQGQVATARSLIAEAQLQVRDGDLNLAALLALEAQRYEPEAAARLLGGEIPTNLSPAASSTAVLGEHGSSVLSVAWSPDGRTLASGSDDSTIKLWDVERGELLQTLQGHGDWVLSVAWSPDGRTLASGSADSTIKLWDEWVWRDRCTWVYANLTPDQWLQFVGRSIYRATCPTRASEPAPSIAAALSGNQEYLYITWPGRLVVVGAALVSLAIVGLLLWGVYHLLRSTRRIIIATTVTALLLALVLILGVMDGHEFARSDWPIFVGALVAGLTLTLLLWVGYRLGRWLLRKLLRRSEVPAS
jgi:hypothetical protein